MEWQDAERQWEYAYQLILQLEEDIKKHILAESKNPEIFIEMWKNREPESYESFAQWFEYIGEDMRLHYIEEWEIDYEKWVQEAKEKSEKLSRYWDKHGYSPHIVWKVYNLLDRDKREREEKALLN